MSQKNRFAGAIALALTMVSIGVAGTWVARSHATSTTATEPVLRVQIRAAEPSDTYDVDRSFVGRIEAARESELGFELAGLLEKVWVEEGDSVVQARSGSRPKRAMQRTRMVFLRWFRSCRGPCRTGPGPSTMDARRRSRSANGSMAETQTTATTRCVWRQPTVSIRCCRIGGQIVPAR